MLSEQSFEPGDAELRELWQEGVPASWLGGPAIEQGEWPVAADGTALTHVASISLAEAQGVVDEEGRAAWLPTLEPGQPGQVLALLPGVGNLEVFHDLSTWGEEPADGASGRWQVRWVESLEGRGLVDGGDPPQAVCQQVMAQPGSSIRCPEDALAASPGVDAAAYLDLYEQWQLDWQVQRFLRREEHPVPTSHVGGHPSHPRALADELLAQCLPLGSGDEHLLVLEVESWTSLAGSFGDAGSLEVWMRASDLADRRFDRAWCLVRTD